MKPQIWWFLKTVVALWRWSLALREFKLKKCLTWRWFQTCSQSWDLSTTSKSMRIRLFSSLLPVRRICFTAMTALLSLWRISTTCPQVPLPRSPISSRSSILVLYCRPLICNRPVWLMISFSLRSCSSLPVASRRRSPPGDGVRASELGNCRLPAPPLVYGPVTLSDGLGRADLPDHDTAGLETLERASSGNWSAFIFALISSALSFIILWRHAAVVSNWNVTTMSLSCFAFRVFCFSFFQRQKWLSHSLNSIYGVVGFVIDHLLTRIIFAKVGSKRSKNKNTFFNSFFLQFKTSSLKFLDLRYDDLRSSESKSEKIDKTYTTIDSFIYDEKNDWHFP